MLHTQRALKVSIPVNQWNKKIESIAQLWLFKSIIPKEIDQYPNSPVNIVVDDD